MKPFVFKGKTCYTYLLRCPKIKGKGGFYVRRPEAYPSPYDYPSADDYYEAVDDYNQWLKDKEEAYAIAADLAYERHLEELLNK